MSDQAADDDSLLSSDSDDDFLTRARDDGKHVVDREALIRKKLMENFYGKSAVSQSSASDDSSDDDDDDDSQGRRGNNRKPAGSSLDLDSPKFDATAHTQKHVLQASVHELLETEEHLACQVRTLDSSLQTLVYENYSRFIQATEAIKSIGVHVQSNEAGLQKLTEGMSTIQDTSRTVEASVGTLRDQVVEKLRVKRLLTRLDTLLKLPQTLRDQIKAGKYRLAAKSYLQAHTILSKHSAGFESLQRIEVECHELLRVMLQDLRRKLIHWSGQVLDGDDDEMVGDDDDEDPPESPRTVAEILECAGTPVLFLSEPKPESSEEDGKTDTEDAPTEETSSSVDPVDLDPGLTAEQCQEMVLTACLRYLERVLDSHHLELQEEKYSLHSSSGQLDDTAGASTRTSLVPTKVLDSILEASTLYQLSFTSFQPVEKGLGNSDRIARFVLEAFGSFLTHVRSELLEQSIEVQQAQQERAESNLSDEKEEDNASTKEEDQKEAEDQANERISTAMVTLLQSVRQLASGLTLPEVGIDPGLASSMVEQTESLTETMVRRRVDSTFMMLRLRIIEECLEPFCQNAMQDPDANAEDSGVMPLVQLASVALSDALQLVDDTIRSIFAEEAATDTAMLREAVELSTKRFSAWLASAIEVLAGCEYSDPRFTFDIKAEKEQGDTGDFYENESKDYGAASSSGSTVSGFDELSITSHDAQDPVRKVDTALMNLEAKHIASGSRKARSNMTLAIAEMCRVAERSVMENISQSIATHSGEKQRKSKTLEGLALGSGEGEAAQAPEDTTSTSRRFRLAASRALCIYATDRGTEAANIFGNDLYQLANEDVTVVAPRDAAWKVLELAKETSIECANLFGTAKRAGPVPDTLQDEIGNYTSSRPGARSGLVFDVERMFAEKVIAYPHPSETIDFTRNAVMTIFMKVAFKGVAENVRLTRFSSHGFRQLKVDVEFLQFLVPHYIKDELSLEGSNAQASVLKVLGDLISAAGERCIDQDFVAEGGDDFINECRAVVREFMASNDEKDGIVSKFTISED